MQKLNATKHTVVQTFCLKRLPFHKNDVFVSFIEYIAGCQKAFFSA